MQCYSSRCSLYTSLSPSSHTTRCISSPLFPLPFPPPFLLLSTLLLLPLFSILYLLINSRRANLSHIPGPFLARYTDAWNLFQAWNIVHWGGKVEFYQKLQAQYGDVVRVGPRSVVALDPAAVPVIYGVRARLDKVCYVTRARQDREEWLSFDSKVIMPISCLLCYQGPAYIPFRQTGVKASLVSIRDEMTHGQYRKMISNAFSLSSLKAYEPCIDEMVNRFMEVCDEHARTAKTLNLSLWCHYCE